MERQFTTSVFIVKEEKILLIFHKKFRKWLPPGGHLLPNELPAEGALREVKEETGLKVALLPEENLWFPDVSTPRPYLCACYPIPQLGDEAPHVHVDFVFVAVPVGGEEVMNAEETEGLRWFSVEEMVKEDLYPETKATFIKVLKDFAPSLAGCAQV